MEINDNVKIMVSEPWDFTSSEGDNVFSGKIQDLIKTSFGDLYLLKVNIPFQLKTFLVNWIVLSRRNNHNSVNVYYLSDENIVSFKDIETIKNELQFIMIGSIKK